MLKILCFVFEILFYNLYKYQKIKILLIKKHRKFFPISDVKSNYLSFKLKLLMSSV